MHEEITNPFAYFAKLQLAEQTVPSLEDGREDRTSRNERIAKQVAEELPVANKTVHRLHSSRRQASYNLRSGEWLIFKRGAASNLNTQPADTAA